MTRIKTKEELEIMKEGGRKLGNILEKLMTLSVAGAIPLELDRVAQNEIEKFGGSPSFFTVRDYKWTTCMCVNDVVVHGIPNIEPLKGDDVVCIDIGMLYKGLHTDTADTKIVGGLKLEVRGEIENFLETGRKALKEAIAVALPGNRMGHISQVIQRRIEGAGYSIVPSLVGHAIGEKLHEQPHIPGVLTIPLENTQLISPGMTLALEVIYTQGQPDIISDPDGWTIRTKDGSLASVFEHTIAVTENGPIVLTQAT